MLLAQCLFNKIFNVSVWNVPFSFKSFLKTSSADVAATVSHLAVARRRQQELNCSSAAVAKICNYQLFQSGHAIVLTLI